jgi:hypothetical protein
MLPNISSDIEIQWKLSLTRIDEWINNDVFRFRWWLLVGMFTFSVVFFWKTVDKSRLKEILIFDVIIITLTLILDELGEELTLWDYPYDLIPLFPPLSAIDIACLPMIYSLIYQHFRTWKKFITATLIMAAIFCFVLEPLFVLTGIYQMLKWKSYYGFPIYTMMAIITKATVNKMIYIAAKVK